MVDFLATWYPCGRGRVSSEGGAGAVTGPRPTAFSVTIANARQKGAVQEGMTGSESGRGGPREPSNPSRFIGGITPCIVQGDPAFSFHSGKVKTAVGPAQGKTRDLFGQKCLVGKAPRRATVPAMTKCVIAQMSKADVTT
jgi:hypothetical protein